MLTSQGKWNCASPRFSLKGAWQLLLPLSWNTHFWGLLLPWKKSGYPVREISGRGSRKALKPHGEGERPKPRPPSVPVNCQLTHSHARNPTLWKQKNWPTEHCQPTELSPQNPQPWSNGCCLKPVSLSVCLFNSVFLNLIFILNWGIVVSQCCASFRCTANWFGYTYTCIHSFSDSFPI